MYASLAFFLVMTDRKGEQQETIWKLKPFLFVVCIVSCPKQNMLFLCLLMLFDFQPFILVWKCWILEILYLTLLEHHKEYLAPPINPSQKKKKKTPINTSIPCTNNPSEHNTHSKHSSYLRHSSLES